jgi:hypothetical protein
MGSFILTESFFYSSMEMLHFLHISPFYAKCPIKIKSGTNEISECPVVLTTKTHLILAINVIGYKL